jgi:hypothetical protein
MLLLSLILIICNINRGEAINIGERLLSKELPVTYKRLTSLVLVRIRALDTLQLSCIAMQGKVR